MPSMRLVKAEGEASWQQASTILFEVVKRMDAKNRSFWTAEQVSVSSLREAYELSQLYWLQLDDELAGLVFLMDMDTYYWPEKTDRTSLFFHKLAIRPAYTGLGLGAAALAEIRQFARRNGYAHVRLDCRDREPLHQFYAGNGFSLVDVKPLGGRKVARYELPVNHPQVVKNP
ncbi:GNAT family N-acetyltransferase [Porticoccus sp. W117]|uniref:GNAT family N-acetyltransferase n=1 Tax=Porticoccus sp. W117 TaxID=3054777 RepID=UPI0025930C86|nr:GNAT family N-acetyltransferase [Porticoccus sp. W117]MDM3872244.1 GNAT family N-acetyltransferase [Porticoccus sp. W117]